VPKINGGRSKRSPAVDLGMVWGRSHRGAASHRPGGILFDGDEEPDAIHYAMRWDMITRDIGAGIMVPKVPNKKYYTFGRSDLENCWGSNTLTLGSKPDGDKPKDSESKPESKSDDDQSEVNIAWGSNTLTLGSKPDDDKPKDSESKPDDDQSEVTIAWGRNTLTLGSNLCPVYS